MFSIVRFSTFSLIQQLFIWLFLFVPVSLLLGDVYVHLGFVVCYLITKHVVRLACRHGFCLNSTPLLWVAKGAIVCLSHVKRIIQKFRQHAYPTQPLPSTDIFSPRLELKAIIHLALRDFIKHWYNWISDHEQFTDDVRILVGIVADTFLERLANIDVYGVVEDIVRIYECHLKDYQKAWQFYCQQPSYRKRSGDPKAEYLRIKDVVHSFRKLDYLHPALRSSQEEQFYLCQIMDEVLKLVIPSDLLHCKAARNVIAEFIANNSLYIFAEIAQDPHFIHEAIILILSDPVQSFRYLGEDEEPYTAMISSLLKPKPAVPSVVVTPCDESSTSNEPERHSEESASRVFVSNPPSCGSLHHSAIFELPNDDDSVQSMDISQHLQPDGISMSGCSTHTQSMYACDATTIFAEHREPGHLRSRSLSNCDIAFPPGSNVLLSDCRRAASLNAIARPMSRNRFDSAEVDTASEALVQLDGGTNTSPDSLFEEISIPSTEQSRDQGAVNIYTLYCIEVRYNSLEIFSY
jgi:hypothetical protein